MNKLVITTKDDVVYYGYFQNGKPLELYCEKKDTDSILGNIYVARVDKIAEGIKGAFLDLGNGQKAYYNMSAFRKPVKLSSGHEDKLYGGDLILVQITKDAVKTKLPVADSNVSLPGKYMVLSLEKRGINISKKIKDPEERKRLLTFVKEAYEDSGQPNCGIVIRTNALGVSESILSKELMQLMRHYDQILKKASVAPGGTLIFGEFPYYMRIARELPISELDEILTDDLDIYHGLLQYYQETEDKDILSKLKRYEEDYSLYLLYRFQHFYDLALSKTVMLKSGGSIVIEQTEAMVVIDVNSGAVLKSGTHLQTVFEKMNREAASEIAHQIRLRNLSGMILIDFINMKNPPSKDQLLDYMKDRCERDRVPVRVVDFTSLNLMEMTRNKVRKPLAQQWKECHIPL